MVPIHFRKVSILLIFDQAFLSLICLLLPLSRHSYAFYVSMFRTPAEWLYCIWGCWTRRARIRGATLHNPLTRRCHAQLYIGAMPTGFCQPLSDIISTWLSITLTRLSAIMSINPAGLRGTDEQACIQPGLFESGTDNGQRQLTGN